MLHLPTLADYELFGAWDGVLMALYIVVSGVCARTAVRILRRYGSTDPTLGTTYTVGSVMMAAGFAGMAMAWTGLPHHGPGIWGAFGVIGILLAYGYTMAYLNKVLRPRSGAGKKWPIAKGIERK